MIRATVLVPFSDLVKFTAIRLNYVAGADRLAFALFLMSRMHHPRELPGSIASIEDVKIIFYYTARSSLQVKKFLF